MDKQELYNLVFEDGKQYTDFYFNKRHNQITSFSTKCGDNIFALVNYVDIELRDLDKTYKAALLSGVCTHPEMRGKGIMKSLLLDVIEVLKTKNYDIVILSPVSDSYYKKFGFESLLKGDFKQIKYTANDKFWIKKATKIDIKLILDLYKEVSKMSKFSQVMTDDIALDLMEEFSMNNSFFQIVYENNKPIGWVTTDSNKVENAVLPDINILNKIKEFDGFLYFEPNTNGNKDLFQIVYLNKDIPHICNDEIFMINKY